MPRLTQTRAERAPLPIDKPENFEWCSEVKGFGARITKGGTRSWVIQQSGSGGKRITLGRVGVLPCETTPDQKGARDLAITALNATRFGKDAKAAVDLKKQPKGMTVNEVWKAYGEAGYPMLRGDGRKAETTVKGDQDRWKKHMEKAIGKKAIGDITNARIQHWADKIATDGQRAHCITQLKSIVGYAVTRGLGQPAEPITIKAAKSKEMQNFYSASDLIALDEAAIALTAQSPHRQGVFSAIRLLLHSGARTGEILSLRWTEIDAARQCIVLKKHKGGDKQAKDIHLSDEAIAIIAAMPQLKGNPWVFPADSKSGHLTTLQSAWDDLIAEAGVARYRRHDLRHSFVSRAINSGVSLYVAGKLVGHRQATTTQRYAHLEADAAKAAMEKIAGAIKAKPPRAA
jgi:integrase